MTTGNVIHILKASDPSFTHFGEVYGSFVDYKAVKAWKKHLRMTLNVVVPVGRVRFAFVDLNYATRVEDIGQERYVRLTIPPNIWFGFSGLTSGPNLVINVANIPHDPAECISEPSTLFPFPAIS